MRERRKKLGTHQLEVRLWTLKDKKSMFRASEPDRHCVEIIANTPRSHVMIRDWWFEDDKKAEATAQYEQLVSLLK